MIVFIIGFFLVVGFIYVMYKSEDFATAAEYVIAGTALILFFALLLAACS